MKNVMTRAWEIAKNAVVEFGGKAIEYIALALRMAWAEIKKGVERMKKEFKVDDKTFIFEEAEIRVVTPRVEVTFEPSKIYHRADKLNNNLKRMFSQTGAQHMTTANVGNQIAYIPIPEDLYAEIKLAYPTKKREKVEIEITHYDRVMEAFNNEHKYDGDHTY